MNGGSGVLPRAARGSNRRRGQAIAARCPPLAGALLAAALAWTGPAAAQPAAPAQAAEPAAAPPPVPTLGVGRPVPVERIRFEGRSPLAEPELEALAAPFTGRMLRGLEIEELLQRVTRTLVDRGHVASGAVLPDAAYHQGTLTVRLVEGRVERVRLAGMERLVDDYVASRLVGRDEALDINRLQERFQLLLADPLISRLNARLVPGATPGTAVLDVDVARAKPWSIGLYANNHLAPAVGSTVAGIDGWVRNLTSWGDTLAATVTKSDGSLGGDASWSLPVFASRTVAALRIARTRSSVIEEPLSTLNIDSVVHTREGTLSHPLVDSARARLLLGVTHSTRHNRTAVDGEPFSFVAGEPTGTTRVESWRLFQELTLRLDRHVVAMRASTVDGRNNVLAETLPGVAAPSRYRLWQVQLQAAIALGDEDQQLVLRGQIQRATRHLVPLEQMAIGGRHTVRGYRENQLVRDNAFAAGAELHWPLWRDAEGRGHVRLVPFVEGGAAWNLGESRGRLASAGIGLVWSVADLEGEIFYARRLKDRPTDTHGDLQDRGIHIALRFRPF